MRIFSKKAFAIGPGAQKGLDTVELFVTVPKAFQDMPDKYADDPTFKLAVSFGDIIVADANNTEKKIVDAEFPDVPQETVKDKIELFYEELKAKNREETLKLADEYSVKYSDDDKLGNIKKRVFEAYKLNNNEN